MSRTSKGGIIPGLRYRNAPAAIDWLCQAFGFSRHLVVPDEDGGIAHAQLVLGSGMIMLGSYRDEWEYDRLVLLPEDAGGSTQAAYVIVDEIEVHYQRAVAAGARIVYELASQDYGGKLYSALDPEGHLWNFGSYDPWAEVSESNEEG